MRPALPTRSSFLKYNSGDLALCKPAATAIAMPRTLPWERGKSQLATSTLATVSPARPGRRPRPDHEDPAAGSGEPAPAQPSPLARSPLPRSRPARSGKLAWTVHPVLTNEAARSPSTSPPPAPPAEAFMRDGLDADDIYMLVEDTFLATARLFTGHLHHAEYARQKRLAQQRNATATKAISRPVDGRTVLSPGAKRQKLQIERRRKTENALKQDRAADAPEGDDMEAEETADKNAMWKGTHLYGLLASPSAKPPPLQALRKRPSKARALAGGGRRGVNAPRLRAARDGTSSSQSASRGKATNQSSGAESGSTTEFDDDLDAPPIPKITKPRLTEAPARRERPSAGAAPQAQTQKTQKGHRKVTFDTAEQAVKREKSPVRARACLADNPFDKLARPTPLPSRRPRARREDGSSVKRVDENREERINEIPIFLV